MRIRSLVPAAIVVTVLCAAVPASAERMRVYKGESSQGIPAKIWVARDDGQRYIPYFDFGTDLTCDDGTSGGGWYFGYYVGDSVPLDEAGAFVFDDVSMSNALHLAGTITRTAGSGTLELIVPALDENEQVQRCSSGELTWTVSYVRTVKVDDARLAERGMELERA